MPPFNLPARRFTIAVQCGIFQVARLRRQNEDGEPDVLARTIENQRSQINQLEDEVKSHAVFNEFPFISTSQLSSERVISW